MKRARGSGFTLMELLIVVIIVGILASIAMPRFNDMVRRARATEGANLVGAVMTAEWLFFQENTAFTDVLANLLVDLPAESANEHFDIAAPALAGAAPNRTVTVVATGDAGSPAAGITITGVLSEDGSRAPLVTVGL